MAATGRCFTDPSKWEEGWFLNLTSEQKLLYLYLWDRCDHAGVVETVLTLIKAHTNYEFTKEDIDSLVEACNQDKERIMPHKGKLWFVEYIRFQQQKDLTQPLKIKKNFHKTVFCKVQENGLVEKLQERDPVLLQEFVPTTNDFSATSNHKPNITQSSPNLTSKGKSGGEGQGESISRSGSRGESGSPPANSATSSPYDPSAFAQSFRGVKK